MVHCVPSNITAIRLVYSHWWLLCSYSAYRTICAQVVGCHKASTLILFPLQFRSAEFVPKFTVHWACSVLFNIATSRMWCVNNLCLWLPGLVWWLTTPPGYLKILDPILNLTYFFKVVQNNVTNTHFQYLHMVSISRLYLLWLQSYGYLKILYQILTFDLLFSMSLKMRSMMPLNYISLHFKLQVPMLCGFRDMPILVVLASLTLT